MSSDIYMSIEIGGTIKSRDLKGLLTAIEDEMFEVIGPTTLPQIRKEATGKFTLRWDGHSSNGECSGIKAFCENHGLFYIHHCNSDGEYDAEMFFFGPGDKEPSQVTTNSSSDPVALTIMVKPITEFLMKYAELGTAAFPLYVGDEMVKELVERCCKEPGRSLEFIQTELDKHLVMPPAELPPFVIMDSKSKKE